MATIKEHEMKNIKGMAIFVGIGALLGAVVSFLSAMGMMRFSEMCKKKYKE